MQPNQFGGALNIPAVSGVEDANSVRVVLLQAGRLVHAPAIALGYQPSDATLTALAALDATAGILVQTGADAFAKRTLQAPAAGITITNPAGTAGDPTFALANDLAGLEGLGSTGFPARTAADTWAVRTLTAPAAGLSITNPAGVAGNPTFALANDLAGVEGLAANGLATRTATDTWTVRTLTGTANEITVSNGDGVSGNPTISLPTALTFTGKTVTGGTFNSTFNGSVGATTPASGAFTTLTASGAFAATSTSRFTQNTTDSPGNGNNTQGVGIQAAGNMAISSNTTSLVVNKTADGTLVSFHSGGTSQGTISVAGATVTYGAMLFTHWSQLAGGAAKIKILRGTIVETIDEMCAWNGEGKEDRLPRFKVSDTLGSKAVYGVFLWWDHDGSDDAVIGAGGAGWIRIGADQTVQRGNLIESNGDGCGRVQADSRVLASTVGKVSSATIVETYPDGSYLVPCTLCSG